MGDNDKDQVEPARDPSREEVDEFLKANNVDDRAAGDLREASLAVQKAVLARGDLSTARNPSAALLVRIRDARVGGGGGGSGVGVGLPSSADIDSFIKRNGIDRKTGDTLRSSSPTIKRLVLAGGDLGPVPDPAAALTQRMGMARQGGASSIVPATMKFPTLQEVDDFLSANEVDSSSADQLRSSPPAVQRVVLSRGDLRSARNPSSALLARIRDAKASPEGQGMMPGMSFPMYPPMGFPPPGPGGFPPGDGNPGGGFGYPPPGYGMYPGMYPGYPGYGMYPGYPSGYPGYPGGAYTGYPGAAPPAAPEAAPQGSAGRERSCSSSYSYSYTPSPSRSRSRSRKPRKAAGGKNGKKPKRK